MSYGVDVHPVYQAGYQFSNPRPEFAWVKVSDGNAPYRKAWPDALVNRGKAAGVAMGGYHYAQPGDAVRQANVLCDEVERLGALGVVPALDIEDDKNQHIWSAGEGRTFITLFTDQVRRRGHVPGVYLNDAMALKLGRPFMESLYANGVVLWVARYASDGVSKLRPRNTPYDVHQYSSTNPALDKNEALNNKHLTASGGGGGSTEGEDMTPDETRSLNECHVALFGDAAPVYPANNDGGLVARVDEIHEKLDALAAPGIDYEKLAAALGESFADQVADKLAARLQS